MLGRVTEEQVLQIRQPFQRRDVGDFVIVEVKKGETALLQLVAETPPSFDNFRQHATIRVRKFSKVCPFA